MLFFISGNFNVGQNIAYKDIFCAEIDKCTKETPDWPNILKMFYDEVESFNKRHVNSMFYVPGLKYGHFTQVTSNFSFTNESKTFVYIIIIM